MFTTISGKTFDKERSLYNVSNAIINSCVFAGEADGESPLKEAKNIVVNDSKFSLRYAFWHVDKFEINNSELNESCRAPLWYCTDGKISNCTIKSIKPLRDCSNIAIEDSKISSPEFGWKSSNITLKNTEIEAEYLFLDCKDIELYDVNMKGKYSFQYLENLVIKDSHIDTKDAFWHAKNVKVINSYIKGEYLAWFSENVEFINCIIEGTQPFCYCKNLVLKDCKMIGTDLAFEYSDVQATIIGSIDSVKNPLSGSIIADDIGEIVKEDDLKNGNATIVVRAK